ncbi:MAG: Rrf2 family transcriptional regulator [Clostridiales bacterium]|nr:Rrf2 family transcriptional regulator [Clostridiales bacterium]
MLISTRGRYALRVLIDIAEHSDDSQYIAMKDVAKRQEISLKYLERILPVLVRAHILEGVHGKGGGYRLTQKPEEYRVGEILRLTDGDLSPVPGIGSETEACDREKENKTIRMWDHLNHIVNEYLDSVRLSDLLKTE